MTVVNSTSESNKPPSKSLLELTSKEAKDFLLKSESYCRIDLPPYFDFNGLISNVAKALDGIFLSDCFADKPRNYENVNYTILNNKDGRYDWRPFQLIHPALYVSLVNVITKEDNWDLICQRFQEFQKNESIRCLSLPVESLSEERDKAEQISQWWHEIEQKSIELSLDYEYMLETDITDCYGAIYTHSIPWALHSKDEAKNNRQNSKYVGNVIDRHIQDMQHGQTNGIPQGSVLMDFIAEMVLGYIDLRLSEALDQGGANRSEYCILRYRDDYRIFVNNPQKGEQIVKFLTEICIDLGLKLNPLKTKVNNDVVQASLKSDKLNWIGKKKSEKSLQKHLIIIHDHAMQFPNAGSLAVALSDYHKRILKITELKELAMPLISIVVDIAYRNPRTYSICAAILSKLLSFLENKEKKQGVIRRIRGKFAQIPNTGHMKIWLQRVTLPFAEDVRYEEPVCKLVSGEDVKLWDTEWIASSQLARAVSGTSIIDSKTLNEIKPIVPSREVQLFIAKAWEEYL